MIIEGAFLVGAFAIIGLMISQFIELVRDT